MVAAVTVFKNFAQKECNKPLEEIIKAITDGKYKTQISKLRNHLKDGKNESANKVKNKLLAFTPSGTFDDGRKATKITSYSGYVILDIDKLSKPQLQETINTSRLAPYTYASFVSPSGNGLKILVAVNSKKEEHKEAYNQVREYYETALNIDIDTSGSDVSRLCFMSFDTDCYFNDAADIFEVEIKKVELKQPTTQSKTISNNDDIEAYILLIEQSGTDITGDYETWRNLGFAISGEYGEVGREYFHRISKFYVGYDYKVCDLQYSKCLTADGSGVNISTFYYKAHSANIKPNSKVIETESTIKNNNNKAEEIPLTFPKSLIPQLPVFLQDVTKHCTTDAEKDIMILGTLTVISACLPKLFGVYDGDKIYSNLFLFVTAPASAGKGKLKYCKELVDPIHKKFREAAALLKSQYNSELAVYNKNKGKDSNLEKPQRPPEKMLFIPANNSTTGVFQLLENSDAKGLIFETEADTLANAFKTDYGNYSEGFRKAFHHETISYYRRTDREYVDMENPCLSTVLSGTPKQVLALMPDSENGLFSRFMFYYMNITPSWKNVFASNTKNGLKEYYDGLGKQFFELYKTLISNTEISFSYTEEQKVKFGNFFSNLNLFYLNVKSPEYVATVRRMGIIAFRISMVLTGLRVLETGDISKNIFCDDEDFKSTLTMVGILIKHSSKVFSSLPIDKTAIKYENRKERFLNKLPLKFTTQKYNSIAKKLAIPEKTVEGYITQFCKSGLIVREFQGNYMNPAKSVNKESEGNKGK